MVNRLVCLLLLVGVNLAVRASDAKEWKELSMDDKFTIYEDKSQNSMLRFIILNCNRCNNELNHPYWDKKGVRPNISLPKWTETMSQSAKSDIYRVWDENTMKPVKFYTRFSCKNCTK